MLGSLEESLETQRRFVADASHELRTPLTSLQTNIDVLRGDIELDPQQRRRAPRRPPPRVAGDALAHRQPARARAQRRRTGAASRSSSTSSSRTRVDRARSRFPSVTWETPVVEPTVVDGDPRPDGARGLEPARERRQVERRREARSRSRSRGGELSVRDHGPGIDERGPRRSSSTASTARPRRARCRARGSGSRSSERSRKRTAAPLPRRTRPAAERVMRLKPRRRSRDRALRLFSSGRDSIRTASNPSRLARLCGPRPARSGAFPDPLRRRRRIGCWFGLLRSVAPKLRDGSAEHDHRPTSNQRAGSDDRAGARRRPASR